MKTILISVFYLFIVFYNIALGQHCSFRIVNSKGQPIRTKLMDKNGGKVILPDADGKYFIQNVNEFNNVLFDLRLQNPLSYLVYDLNLYINLDDSTSLPYQNVDLNTLCTAGIAVFYMKNKEKKLEN